LRPRVVIKQFQGFDVECVITAAWAKIRRGTDDAHRTSRGVVEGGHGKRGVCWMVKYPHGLEGEQERYVKKGRGQNGPTPKIMNWKNRPLKGKSEETERLTYPAENAC
jgi:hypothetical protein